MVNKLAKLVGMYFDAGGSTRQPPKHGGTPG